MGQGMVIWNGKEMTKKEEKNKDLERTETWTRLKEQGKKCRLGSWIET